MNSLSILLQASPGRTKFHRGL